MPCIIVCPLAEIEAVASMHQPSHMISLVEASTPVRRPETVTQDRHLFLAMNDITGGIAGLTEPVHAHVQALLQFGKEWAHLLSEQPLLVHCWLGISRSTAAAFILACALQPQADEHMVARHLRKKAPFATPNPRLVELADALLERHGRMVNAIRRIGRGASAASGRPFILDI